MNLVNIRLMKEEDLKEVLLIEKESFSDAWTRKHYLYELNDNPFSVLYVIENKEEIIGYIAFMITFHVGQLSKIAINKKYRNYNYATLLMEKMIEHLLEIHNEVVETISLEVRASNYQAIKFYEKHNFEIILRKERYYQDGEDAYYMLRRLI